ncbi:RNA-directed DNA polymerase, eukaryota, reverse transcriptase zinc-binding domain protein [Tanacetum coccineum]|uniref:RNA-directed DNA polymerase, eukaryota, reverse transcriptase zinc-binding domain protein n=1 Tax=Tanacetum coccineum TaxID=301880 RepID=A0ABQ5F5P0_9ASTR
MNKLNWKNGDLTVRVEMTRVKLQEAQTLVEKNPHDCSIKEKVVQALCDYNEAVTDEEKLLAQKARIKWLNEGDKNSSYFHKVIKGRRSRNRVDVICDERAILDDEGLFSTMLNQDEAEDMIRVVSNKEIKDAMFDIGDNRAPGPDGYSSLFFKRAWNVVGNDVCDVVKEFFDSGQMLGELNATLISLKLVQINQSAFIPGRVIQDNILLSQEILRGYGRQQGPKRCAMKIDLQKAYDTVNWNFLELILKKFGFHTRIVGWIMQCVKTVGFTVCINGKRYGYFKGGRGLRQGDPISPYLFTLIMEMLTLLLQRKIRNNGCFKYHHGCKELQLVNLCFTDDLMIFCNGDPISVGLIKEGLNEFSATSGLFRNLRKSTLFFGSLKDEEKEQNKKVKWIHMMKLKEGSIWNVQYSSNDSWQWKCLLDIRDKIADRLQYKIGDGTKVSLWYDKWHSSGLLINHVTNRDLYDARIPKMISISDMIDEGVWKWPLEWDSNEFEFMKLRVPLITNGMTDKVKRRNDENKLVPFHMKFMCVAISPNTEKVRWYKLVWFKQCIPKHSFCLWLAMNGRLLTQDRIMAWGAQTGLLCPLCSKENDSHKHLLFLCDYSKYVWKWMAAKMNMRKIEFIWEDVINEILQSKVGNNIWSAVKRICLSAVVYYIWQERNQRIFQGLKRDSMK